MIVPSNRLLIMTGIVITPLALLPALSQAEVVAVCGAAFLLVLSLVDVMAGRARIRAFGVKLPEVVRLSKDRETGIEFTVLRRSGKEQRLRLGLSLPNGIVSPVQDMVVELDKESETFSVFWPCTGARRGRFMIENCYFEMLSPLGLWAVRSVASVETEVRVYPNLIAERRSLAALFLNKGLYGMHVMHQVGKGREFEHLRNYVTGDSYEDISWKATARRSHPISKVYQIEKTQEVYVIVDGSRLSGRQSKNLPNPEPQPAKNGAATGTILERFLNAALVTGLTAERQGDLFGLMTYSDTVERFVRARNGKPHFNACRDALYTLQPKLVTPDFAELFSFVALKLRRRGLLIFLTSLDDHALAESFIKNIHIIARRHVVMVNMIKPHLAQPIFSDQHIDRVEDVYRNLGGHLLWARLRETEKVLRQKGVGFFMLDNENLSPQLVSQYLSVKHRQLI